jgi:hypothetical protein
MNHTSDCALHNGPATAPLPCDCGVDPTMTPAKYGSELPLIENRVWLNLGADICSLIGYLQALKPGDEITAAYHERLNKHYIDQLIQNKNLFDDVWNKRNRSKGGQS